MRDEIDKRGGKNPFRRAIIIGAHVLEDSYTKDSKRILRNCPMICIGGEVINAATESVRKAAKAKGEKEFSLGTGHAVFVNDGSPRVAIWADDAAATHAATVKYISEKRGLDEFLGFCWK